MGYAHKAVDVGTERVREEEQNPGKEQEEDVQASHAKPNGEAAERWRIEFVAANVREDHITNAKIIKEIRI